MKEAVRIIFCTASFYFRQFLLNHCPDERLLYIIAMAAYRQTV
jgi:hypothetical protein